MVSSLPVPVANFTGSPLSGSPPLAVTFTDSSTNSPTSWSWTFGDSSTSTAQSPSHTYSSNGTYTVALTATNASGSNTCTKTGYITVASVPAPVANFSGTPTSGSAPLSVSFTDSSTNTPTSWSWTFGDTNTSTAQNPSHTYTANGTYTVALTVTNAGGSDTNTKSSYISVSSGGGSQVECFLQSQDTGGYTASSGSISDTHVADGVCESFNITNGNPTYYGMRFWGNFYTSYAANQLSKIRIEYKVKSNLNGCPDAWLIAYAADGTQYPSSRQSLTTSNTTFAYETTDVASFMRSSGIVVGAMCVCGAQPSTFSVDQAHMIVTVGVPPVANLTGAPLAGAAPLAVAFTDTSTNAPTAWSWSFGDSTTDTVQNPSHTYTAAGTYTVALTATNGAGNNTCTKTNYITATTPTTVDYHLAWATPSVQPTSGSLSDTYTEDGVYEVFNANVGNPTYYGFTIYSAYNTAYTASQVSKIKIEWKAKSNLTGKPNAWLVIFDTNNNQYTTTAVQLNTTNQTLSWETTDVATFLRSDGSIWNRICSCTDQAYTISIDQAHVILTLVGGGTQPPVADFTATPTNGNAPLSVSFADVSTNTPTSWSWTFGDGYTSTIQNPSHVYNTAGTYTVALTATNAGGSDTNTKTGCISVLPPAPVADFTATPTTGPYPLTVAFTDTSTQGPTAWQWTFGDGTTSTAQNPTHTYALGTYTVALIAANSGGMDTETKTNYISATTTAYAYLDYQDITGTGWGPNDTLISGTLADTQTDNQVYRVIQGGADGHYCTWDEFLTSYTASQLVKIHVDYQAKSSVAGTPSYNLLAYDTLGGYHVTNTATTLGTSESTLSWETYDVPTFLRTNGRVPLRECGCPQIANQQYQISVDLARMTLTLGDGGTPVPTANFSASATSVPVNTAVNFTDSSTGSPTGWGWNFGDYCLSSTQSPSHTYTAAGTYTVVLTAVNVHGANTMTKTNYITVGNAPVANFSGTPTSGAKPLSVTFTDSSTNTPTSWSWTFGDGSSSTAQNPSHSFVNAGTYTVALTATNAFGNNTKTQTNYITVTGSIPTFVAAGAVAYGTGAITPALPSGITTNDILLLFLDTSNQSITIPTPNGGTWTQVTNSPQGTGTGGSSGSVALTVFWSRYNGTQGAPTTSDSGDHQIGRMIAIRGATTSGNPWDVTAGGVDATASTTATIPGATTTVANTLVVVACATGLPNSNGTANFSAWTNSNLSSLTEYTDNTRAVGVGGGLGSAAGGKATAGAYGNTTVTLAASAKKGMMSIAIKP